MDGDGLRENDPYNELLDSERDDIRPDFLSDAVGDDSEDGKKRRAKEKNDSARDALGNAENEAGETGNKDGGFYRPGGGIDNAREEESKAGGYYSGDGGKEKEKGKKKGSFGLMGIVPSFVIMFVLGVGGALTGLQTLMPTAIQELIIEKFNSVGVSSTLSSDAWLDVQLNQGVKLESVDRKETENLFAFSEYQVESFEKHGIMVVSAEFTENDTAQITALVYERADGTYIPVIGSDFLKYDSDKLRVAVADGLANSGHNIPSDRIGAPISVKEALSDTSFKNPYTTASKGWRGGSSGWFDDIMSNITETKLSITRNRWARYTAQDIRSVSEFFNEIAADAEKLGRVEDGGLEGDDPDNPIYVGDDEQYHSGTEIGEETGEDGVTHIVSRVDDSDGEKVQVEAKKAGTVDTGEDELPRMSKLANKVVDSGAYKNISNILNSKALKVGVKAATVGCGVVEALSTIYTIASSYQSLQFLNLVSGFLEAVDKVKAGDGDESPIHEYAKNLSTKAYTVDSNSGEERLKSSVPKTAMESQGMSHLFGNDKLDSSDTSVQNINFESLMSNMSTLTKNSGYTSKTFEACGYARITANTIGLVTTVISFIPVIGQGVKSVEVIINAAKQMAVSIAIATALNFIIPIATNKIAELVFKNVATEWFGEDLGNALYSGASKYLGGNGTSGGQSGGSREKVLAYMQEKGKVVMEEASYQRSIRSPFDMTSKYTFFGSLAYSMLPIITSSNFGSALKSFSSLSGNSIASLSPAASAIGEYDEIPPEGTCPLLESTGAVGDAFCNPYIITDVSTIGYSPVAINEIVHRIGDDDSVAANSTYQNVISKNFDENGEIDEESNLAKYITYCGQRVSSYGIRDAAILQMTSGNVTARTVMSVIPVAGEISEIINTGIDFENLKWVTGEQCIATYDSGDGPVSADGNYQNNASDWENEYKYYQRYAENERLLGNMDPKYKSPINSYIEKSYEKNPVDQSLEGQLARFSGLSKEKVVETLDLISYINYISNYDPAERYAFGAPVIEKKKELIFDNENKLSNTFVILFNEISYADVRNRNFVV